MNLFRKTASAPLASLVLVASLTFLPSQAWPLELWEIQGIGALSPYVQREVRTIGNIVTAVGPEGFFIQTPSERSDGDSATSDGLHVYFDGSSPLEIGDVVNVDGLVIEFFGLTELSDVTKLVVTGTAPSLPTPIELDALLPSPTPSDGRSGTNHDLERFEGMLVAFSSGTTTAPTDRFGKISIVAQGSRTFREPGIRFPGLANLPVWDGNPEVFEMAPAALSGHAIPLPAGAPIKRCEGPLTFDFGEYQVWPVALEVISPPIAHSVRARQPREVTVATQNLFRLFDSTDEPTRADPILTAEELDLRLSKLSLLIVELLRVPDVLAVQEVENEVVLEALAARVHALRPDTHYSAIVADGDDPSGMDVGFLVDSSVFVREVQALGSDAVFTFAGSTRRTFARPPLLVNLLVGEDNEPLRIVNVHLKSLRGIDSDPFVRRLRQEQASWLATEIQTLQSSTPGEPLLVTGDFNAFEFTDGYVDVLGALTGTPDPRGALLTIPKRVEPPLENTIWQLPPIKRYSFIFDGNSQALDHMLLSRSLSNWARDVQFARGNADAPIGYAKEAASPLRASDHDGLVLYLEPTARAASFIRGDTDGDGTIRREDVLFLLQHLFAGGSPLPCWEGGDANGDERVDISDAVWLLRVMLKLDSPSEQVALCEPSTMNCNRYTLCP